MIFDGPVGSVVLGVIVLGCAIYSVVSGTTVIPMAGVLHRDKAPRAFWTVTALVTLAGSSLIYSGLTAPLANH